MNIKKITLFIIILIIILFLIKYFNIIPKINHEIINIQYNINQTLGNLIKSIKENPQNLINASIISFLFGIIHAAGPGHGKTFAASIFLEDKTSNAKKSIIFGNIFAITHTLSAIILISFFYFIIKDILFIDSETPTKIIKLISSSFLILLGIFLLIKNIKDKNDAPKNKEYKITAFLAGIVPCPGVMTIMLFSISYDFYIQGIILSIAMSIGMGLTVTISALLSHYFRIFLDKKIFNFKKGQKIISTFASIMIIFFGLISLNLY
ncbi:hypothetical protein OF820_05680 [Oceanotoga sp. DSM 15011]|jgi:ABC-type nickel/cobalt efflux system permease component RcnA|uniref:Nickel/cobalt efflux system n=1 Tax=Oceanotoga teriensis TaxID=515440 RepID=A0AA45HIQ8_9BACT|nr:MULTISPECIES: hypothetical protein [Oceanotoga]MDN5342850.1 nickel/cobalt transporter (NicO) family protein [Oceanotoga sp.]MDO7976335.1 hypothetical protein [Oceanotoga teriensis]PWJ93181.1 ABC-type nickel/cobalt efflux system permease component RcnA [Oceanotoga teriensis]UYP01175.1 hypothetical protein OF820_05680 [Oceanotoga sp. DSM 15011]